MLKVVSLVFSFVILIQSFDIHLSDIVELDELIAHAQFHEEEYGDNFFVFISKHYGDLKAEHNQQHQEEKEDHERLPFQHQFHTGSLSVFVLIQISEYPFNIEMVVDQDSNYFYQASYHSLAQEELLQPPRHA